MRSIGFWKQRIESTKVEETFAVGVLCGPSGCGKSSLVKAADENVWNRLMRGEDLVA